MPFCPRKQVQVRNNVLVAAFDKSNPPVVWHFDLSRNHSFAMAVQGQDGDWALGVLSPRGDFTSVARFEEREDVDAALKHVRLALMGAQNKFLTRAVQACLAVFLIIVTLAAATLAVDALLTWNAQRISASAPVARQGAMPHYEYSPPQARPPAAMPEAAVPALQEPAGAAAEDGAHDLKPGSGKTR